MSAGRAFSRPCALLRMTAHATVKLRGCTEKVICSLVFVGALRGGLVLQLARQESKWNRGLPCYQVPGPLAPAPLNKISREGPGCDTSHLRTGMATGYGFQRLAGTGEYACRLKEPCRHGLERCIVELSTLTHCDVSWVTSKQLPS